MASTIVITVYVVIGAGAAASAIHRDPRPSLRPLLMLLLWPFLLPAALFAEPLPLRGGHRLAALGEELRIALARSCGARERELEIVESFIERTIAEERTLSELDEAIASSPQSVRGRLQELRDRTHHRIEAGVAMLEEMLAQLTLLRFSELSLKDGEEERRRIEDLLARIEALANLASDEGPRRGALP